MYRFLMIVSIVFLTACSDNMDCCVVVDTATDIHFVKPDGSNFFDTLAGMPDIKVFFEKKGIKEEIYRGNLDFPKMYFFYISNGKYMMRLFPSDYLESNYSTTYIVLNESDMDTIFCKFNTENNNIICTDLWYNGLKRCDPTQARNFEVIKFDTL